MATAIKGINVFLLFRKLAEAENTEAKRLAFQTEHDRNIEADSSNTVTKDGNVNVPWSRNGRNERKINSCSR